MISTQHANSTKNIDQFRCNVAQQFASILADNEKQGVNLEKAIYNWSIKEATSKKIIKKWANVQFFLIYKTRLRSIYNNLKDPAIFNAISSGEMSVQTLAFMTHHEMSPSRWDELIKTKSIKDKNKYEQNIESMTDIFTCRKCKSKKCSFYQLQTRGADEPMTIFVTCLECGQRWKTS